MCVCVCMQARWEEGSGKGLEMGERVISVLLMQIPVQTEIGKPETRDGKCHAFLLLGH